MAIEILMPALSPTMTEGKLSRWLKNKGDAIKTGEVIAEIETDKATMEIEAVDDGTMAEIIVPAGTENVQVNALIALVAAEGEDFNAVTRATSLPSVVAGVAAPAVVTAAAAAPVAQLVNYEEYSGATVKQTVREALRDAMAEEMRRDSTVFLMGEEVAQYQGAYKVSQGLLEEFGDRRVIDTPITEIGFAGLGVGAALAGLRPIVEFMTFNFAMQAMDHIINSAAKTLYMSGGQMGCPIVFRGPNGVASRVGAQHSQCFASWYAHCPGLKVVAPYSAADAKGLLKTAIRDPNPIIFLEHELLYGTSFDVPADESVTIPFGKARIARPGKDVTLVSFSFGVKIALEAAEILSAEGIAAEVIDLRSLRPLDTATILASLAKTNRLVTIEEGWAYSGIGSEIAAQVMEHGFDDLDAPVARVCGADVPLPYAANLEKLALPQAADVVRAAKGVLYR
ncbi:MAG: pyruvate dehydrogenase complex E1 component subunit beta [Alphaproteobacteria bacterium]|nr:pyruvate dehydrogenase complex E1 component subunit beta [Alphaproteobacteria bacterium]